MTTIAYIEIDLDGETLGQIQFKLYMDSAPNASENFVSLCRGSMGYCEKSGKPMCYKGSKIYKIIPGLYFQFGDYIYNNGYGGQSVYGKEFADENLKFMQNRRGLLAMANKGKNTNTSEIIVSFRELPNLTGKHTIFGEAIKGFNVIDKLEALNTDAEDRPLQKVAITKCGVIEQKEPPRKQSSLSSSSYSSSYSRSNSRSSSNSRRSHSK